MMGTLDSYKRKWISNNSSVSWYNWGYNRYNQNAYFECVGVYVDKYIPINNNLYGKWFDVPCSYYQGVVCEKSLSIQN